MNVYKKLIETLYLSKLFAYGYSQPNHYHAKSSFKTSVKVVRTTGNPIYIWMIHIAYRISSISFRANYFFLTWTLLKIQIVATSLIFFT